MLEFAYVSPEDHSSRLFERFGTHITGLARLAAATIQSLRGLLELLSNAVNRNCTGRRVRTCIPLTRWLSWYTLI